MKVKTEELNGPALDWAVATCMGYTNLHHRELKGYEVPTTVLAMDAQYGWVELSEMDYSTDWSRGGPIIEQEGINITTIDALDGPYWEAYMPYGMSDDSAEGPTPLIAAMRCFVVSKLGHEVEIPDELFSFA